MTDRELPRGGVGGRGEASLAKKPQAEKDSRAESASERERRALYERLRRAADLDAIHDLLAKHGPQILDRGFPYLIVSARNRVRSQQRRAAIRREISSDDVREAEFPFWDPFERIAQREDLRRVAEALAGLDDEEILVIWRHTEGRSDREIQAEWDEHGFEPPSPNPAYLRKRRERARKRLRKLLEE